MATSRWIVHSPIASLRQLPGDSPSSWTGNRWAKDPYLDTQLLYGETVQVAAQTKDWAYVFVPSQPRFLKGWRPYSGWISKKVLRYTDDLSYGIVKTWTQPIFQAPSEDNPPVGELRCGAQIVGRPVLSKGDLWIELSCGGYLPLKKISQTTTFDLEGFLRQWEGSPYLWGGTSPYNPACRAARSGVDCSGLVWLAQRMQGRIVPRDAHDQWLMAKPLPNAAHLRCGDLVFFNDEDPHSRIHHVMIYLRDHLLIEAAGSTGCVHLSSLEARCRTHPETSCGSWTGQFRVWFGRFENPERLSYNV